MAATTFRTCPLCEATCGLALTLDGDTITDVRGDAEDVFSRGYICPKGTAVAHLQSDPDRLRRPLVRRDGALQEADWDEAYAVMEQGLRGVIDAHGNEAVALYVGNPSVHSLSISVMLPMLLRALDSPNFYSAATVDQMPKHVTCGLMFGRPDLIPVPDLDRTDYLLVLGANPWVSNGSLATAPDFKGRVKAIRARGGKVVVIDPRRTQTAEAADEHHFIRPGTDAVLVLALAHVLVTEQRTGLGDLAEHVAGLDALPALVAPFSPEVAAGVTGIPAEVIRRLARELSSAPTACVYDRVGVHQAEFGTLCSWGCDVVNVLTGNLDRPGGRMFPMAAHVAPDPATPSGRGWRMGRFASRVKGYPEVYNQLPIATLADEISEPGEGQVRALISLAGNPVLSTPNGRRLAGAIESLDFMVALDLYVNETTRFADVILPPPPLLARAHFDVAFYPLAVRNVANYSPPTTTWDGPDEWESMARLALVLAGQPVTLDPAIVPGMALSSLVGRAVGAGGSLEGRDAEEITAALAGRGPIEQLLDLRLRAGAYGDRFGANPEGLSLDVLEANPHGIDLGPLTPRLPNALKTASGKVELAPPEITADLPRLQASLDGQPAELVLIGRRHLRTNNSWMHNVPTMVRGSNRCTLLVHVDDAARLGLVDGELAVVRSRVGEVTAPVEVCDEIMPGVVSLPHGWGHDQDGVRMTVARAAAGVSVNDLTDEQVIDPLSGNAVLNAVPVSVAPAAVSAAAPTEEPAGV